MKDKYVLNPRSLSLEGHPDKLCDTIALTP